MKNKWIILVITIVIAVFMGIIYRKENNNLINPQSPLSTLSPTPSLKQYRFDSSTDLKKELENINPQVLDSDFE